MTDPRTGRPLFSMLRDTYVPILLFPQPIHLYPAVPRLDGLGAPYVRRFVSSLRIQRISWRLCSDSFDVPSFFQLHDLDRCVVSQTPVYSNLR